MLIAFRTLNHVFYINSEDTIHFSNTVTKTVNLSILGGKVPGFSAKTVHFPPRPAGAPAPQTSLAAPAISTLGESAGFFCENGSLSPAAGRGTGSTGLSCRTCSLSPRGKVPGFSTKTVHFPPWPAGVPAPQAPLAALGISTSRESAGNFGENGSLSPRVSVVKIRHGSRGRGPPRSGGRAWSFRLLDFH